MCKCTPSVRIPFCGKLGCEWPEKRRTKANGGRPPAPEITTIDVKEIAKISLEPGELLVIELPGNGTMHQFERLRKHLKMSAPELADRTLVHVGLKFLKITEDSNAN